MVKRLHSRGFSLSRIEAARLAAVRERRKPSYKEPTAWEIAEIYWNRLARLALNSVPVFAAVFVLYFVWESITQKVIFIAPISVPQALASKGYTPEVIAQRLESSLTEIINRAHTWREGPDIALQAELPSIILADTGLSTEAIGSHLRRIFGNDSHCNVSGEITSRQEVLTLHLRVRHQDHDVRAEGSNPDMDDLFVRAAQRILEQIDPIILATALSKRDPGKSLEITDQIISNWPETDPELAWAYYLRGRILRGLGKTRRDEGINAYQMAIEAYRSAKEQSPTPIEAFLSWIGANDTFVAARLSAFGLIRPPDFALAHSNLGYARMVEKSYDLANREFEKAIKIDGDLPGPYAGKCIVLSKKKSREEEVKDCVSTAKEKYQRMFNRFPGLGTPHIRLGIVMGRLKFTKTAIEEFKKAVKLNPRDALAYTNLGIVFRMEKNPDAAIKALRQAIECDPYYVVPVILLADLLRTGNRSEAIELYRNAINRVRSNTQPYVNEIDTLRDEQDSENAIDSFRRAIEPDAGGQDGDNILDNAELHEALSQSKVVPSPPT